MENVRCIWTAYLNPVLFSPPSVHVIPSNCMKWPLSTRGLWPQGEGCSLSSSESRHKKRRKALAWHWIPSGWGRFTLWRPHGEGTKSRVSHSWSWPSGVTAYQTATWEPCDIFKAFDWLRMLKVKLIQNLKLFKNGFVCRLQPFTSASSTCPTLTACTTLTFHQEKLHIYEHVIYVLIDYTLVVILKMNGYNSQQGDNSNLINMVCPFLQSSLAVHQ